MTLKKYLKITTTLFLFTAIGFADEANLPAVITSDKLDHDANTDVTTASGNVKITQGAKILSADTVSYNKKTDTVYAQGNVWFKDDTGEIYFSDDSTFSNKMADGFVNEIKGIMLDNGRLAARTAQRIQGRKMIFRNALYSPCNVCKENPDIAPLWQIKANKVIHNKEEQVIEYHHMRLEAGGLPFFYTPYFRHADPTVKRKSGFLKPEYGSSTDLGKFVSAPVYLALAPNYDATLMPIFTTEQGVLMTGEYRHRFTDGRLYINGSYKDHHCHKHDKHTAALMNIGEKPPRQRWHIFIDGRYDLSDDHLLTIDINRASDTTYLKRYPVLPPGYSLQTRQSVLTSMIALEQFKNTSYASIRGYSFQTEPKRVSPHITPLAEFKYESLPGQFAQTWFFDASFLNLHRMDPIPGRSPADMSRFSFTSGFQAPFITQFGDIWRVKSAIRWDHYFVHKYIAAGHPRLIEEETFKRFYPATAFEWRYPWVAYFTNTSWVLEPNAGIFVSRQNGNKIHGEDFIIPIPNEDSVFTTLDQTTLFALNRFYGIDRIDSGRRFVYGLKSKMYFPNNAKLFLFFGQSMRLDRKRILQQGSGEHKEASDYIASIHISPGPSFDLQNRMMLSKKDFALRISESTLTWNTRFYSLSGTHTYLNKRVTRGQQKISQITWTIGTKPLYNWSATYGETRNLFPEKILGTHKRETGCLTRSAGLQFQNECLGIHLSIARTAFRDRDVRPATTVLFTIDFKNLGTVSPLSFIGNPFNSPNADLNRLR